MVRDVDEWYESYKAMVEKAMNKYFLLHIIYYLSPSTRRLLDWCWGMSKSTIVRYYMYLRSQDFAMGGGLE